MGAIPDCRKLVKRFGEDLHDWIRTHDRWHLLIYRPLDWLPGGCWTTAEALQQWIGSPAKLWSVVDKDGTVHHVVVKVGSCFFDAWGAWTRREVLTGWESEGGIAQPGLEVFERHIGEASELECSLEAVKDLIHDLEQKFGPGDQVLSWARGEFRPK